MNIPLKMNRDFEKAMAVLNEKYGEDFEFLNGFHETQLNFSDFIDGFIDRNVADVTGYDYVFPCDEGKVSKQCHIHFCPQGLI